MIHISPRQALGYILATGITLYGEWLSRQAEVGSADLVLVGSLMIAVPIAVAVVLADLFAFYCVLLFWLPFSNAFGAFQIGIGTMTLYTAGMLFLFGVGLSRRIAMPTRNSLTTTDLLVLALVCLYVASTALSDDLVDSGYLFAHAILIPAISYFVAKEFSTKSESQFRAAKWWLCAGVTAICGLAVGQFLFDSTHSTRVYVMERDSIAIATFSVTGVGLLLYATERRNIVWWAALVLGIAGLIVSFSRLYILLFALSPIMFLLFRIGAATRFVSFCIALTLVGTFWMTENAELVRPSSLSMQYENAPERVSDPDAWKRGLYLRLLTFQVSLENFGKSPIWGNGLRREKGKAETTHNFHLEWLEYGGVVGYLIYCGILVSHTRRVSRLCATDAPMAAVSTIVLVILLNGLTNGFMHGVMPYVAFLLLGMSEGRAAALSRNVEVWGREHIAPLCPPGNSSANSNDESRTLGSNYK